jgi:predicted glutamine amidotransferase
MCGLFTVINSEKSAVLGLPDIMSDGLLTAQLRGTDSTGLAALTTGEGIISYKKAVNASDFVELKHSQRILAEASVNWVTLGHCRKATQGSIIDSAAHPFLVNGENGEPYLAGIHNGTLSGWDNKKFVSDSHWAFNQIAENGVEAISKFEGAFSLIWANQDDHTLHFVTNGRRPLYYAYVKGKKVMLLASEPGQLAWVMERADERLYAANKLELEGNIYQAEVDKVYTVDLNDCTKMKKEALPKKPIGAAAGSAEKAGIGLNTWDDYDMEYGNNGFYGAPWNNRHAARTEYVPLRTKVLSSLSLIKVEAESKGLAEKTTNVDAAQDTVTEEERELFKEVTGRPMIRAEVKFEDYDETTRTLYLEILTSDSNKVTKHDSALIRGIERGKAKYIKSKASKFEVVLLGIEMETSVEHSTTFIADKKPIIRLAA